MPPTTPPDNSHSSGPPPSGPQPPRSSEPKPPNNLSRSWSRLAARANNISGVATLIVALLVIGGAAGFWFGYLRKPANAPKQPAIETLSKEELDKLTDISTSLGNSNQTLNIGANSLFRGNVNVTSDLTVGGRFNANGPVTLSQLSINGSAALGGLTVGSDLTVGGATTLQKGLTVAGLVAVNGGLNVSGTASVNALNANNISVRTISISGPLLISHLQTQGATPTATAGSAVGGGGTISLSGNDAAGTLNVNSGSGTAAGILATVVFRAAYTGTVHVLLSPLTGPSASLPAYVTRTPTGFQVRTDSAPPAGTVFSFDYFVTQ